MAKRIEVPADLSGTVWKVVVSQGQAVEEGEVLAVLESMKMEIPVEAPGGGVVVSIHCQEQREVAEGDVLFVIEQGVQQ